jgi:hypothetical protein
MNDNEFDRIQKLERRVDLLQTIVIAQFLVLCAFALPFLPVIAVVAVFLLPILVVVLCFMHKQIPPLAREIGRWFAPLPQQSHESRQR